MSLYGAGLWWRGYVGWCYRFKTTRQLEVLDLCCRGDFHLPFPPPGGLLPLPPPDGLPVVFGQFGFP